MTTSGSLYRNLAKLRGRMDKIAAMTPKQAIRDFVGENTGQEGRRLTMLLAVTGLNGTSRSRRRKGRGGLVCRIRE